MKNIVHAICALMITAAVCAGVLMVAKAGQDAVPNLSKPIAEEVVQQALPQMHTQIEGIVKQTTSDWLTNSLQPALLEKLTALAQQKLDQLSTEWEPQVQQWQQQAEQYVQQAAPPPEELQLVVADALYQGIIQRLQQPQAGQELWEAFLAAMQQPGETLTPVP